MGRSLVNFVVLPQGYLHSPAFVTVWCHKIQLPGVGPHGANVHCADGAVLTSDSLADVNALPAVYSRLSTHGGGQPTTARLRDRLFTQILGSCRVGQDKVSPEALTGKVQAHLEQRHSCGLLVSGALASAHPHLAQLLQPLYPWSRRGSLRLGSKVKEGFLAAKAVARPSGQRRAPLGCGGSYGRKLGADMFLLRDSWQPCAALQACEALWHKGKGL